MQGVAEVLPVSSSAHLTLLPWLRRWPVEPGRTTLAAGLHAGSCVGIACALRRELPRRPGELARFALASVPAAAAGAVLADPVEARLGRPDQVGVLMAVAGAALGVADRRAGARALRGLPEVAAAGAQITALVPGVSRSGAVLTALRALGVDRSAAWRHSLLLSLPITAGAAGLTLARADPTLVRQVLPGLAVGAPVAAVVSALVVKRVSTVNLRHVALYRLGLGAVVTAEQIRRRRQVSSS